MISLDQWFWEKWDRKACITEVIRFNI